MWLFIRAIPYNYYALLTILMMVGLIIMAGMIFILRYVLKPTDEAAAAAEAAPAEAAEAPKE